MEKETARIIWSAARSKFDKMPTRVDNDFEKWWKDEREQALNLHNVVKRTLERKEAAYACVNMWYEKEYDSSTHDDEVTSMDKEAAELNAQIKVLRHILSEVGEL